MLDDSHVSDEELLLFAIRRPRRSLAGRLHITCLLFNSRTMPWTVALSQDMSTAVGLSPPTAAAQEVVHEKHDVL